MIDEPFLSRPGIRQPDYRSPQGFGGPRLAGGAYFSMADGSVRFVSERIETDVLRALSTPDGGEEVDATTLPAAR
jgi:hypothetical protein